MAIPNRLDNSCCLVILCPYIETTVNKTQYGIGHYSGVLWDASSCLHCLWIVALHSARSGS